MKKDRRRQGSNLRSHRETDFKSVALTTRPRLLYDIAVFTWSTSPFTIYHSQLTKKSWKVTSDFLFINNSSNNFLMM